MSVIQGPCISSQVMHPVCCLLQSISGACLVVCRFIERCPSEIAMHSVYAVLPLAYRRCVSVYAAGVDKAMPAPASLQKPVDTKLKHSQTAGSCCY